MQYYKDKSGEVFAFESDEEMQQWRPGLTRMTEGEVDAHLHPEPTEEQLAGQVRAERDSKLSATDLPALRFLESDGTVPAEWKIYRQALRDVPEQPGFPHDIDWPEAPDA